MKETEQPPQGLLEKMFALTESRMQKIRPTETGYYRKNMQEFWSTFSQKNGFEIRREDGFVLAGNPLYFDATTQIVKPEIEKITTIASTPVDPFFIFIGDGETMNRDYRRIGNSPPPYPFAISGALDCYLNTDWFESLGINHPAVKRAISHEPRHTAWSLVLVKNGQPTFQTDRNKIIHEALGGPLAIDRWSDVQNIDVPVQELGNTVDFYDWLSKKQMELNHDEQYFLNPIVKAFYGWAESRGDEKFWFTEAQKIPNL